MLYEDHNDLHHKKNKEIKTNFSEEKKQLEDHFL